MLCLRTASFTAVAILGLAHGASVDAQIIFGPRVELESLNTTVADDDPTISEDELTLIFSSTRAGTRGLWQATRTDTADPWGNPTDLGPVINPGYSRYPSLSADGLSLYFSDGYLDAGAGSGFGQPRPGGLGGADIWVSTRESTNQAWSEPENVSINTGRGEDSPVLSADGLSLYFSSNRPGGLGGNDIYAAHRVSVDDAWSEPRNLAQLNSTADDYMGGLSSDGMLIFFDSDRSGGVGAGDIYVASRPDTGAEFGNPINAGQAINSTNWDFRGSPSADGSTLYFAQGGGNSNDLWQAPMMQAVPQRISAQNGSYEVNFDDLGHDGLVVGASLPEGWMATNGVIASTFTTQPFFANGRNREVQGNMDVLNAGAEDEQDRALITGVTGSGIGNELRWFTQVEDGNVSALRLSFDLEAWGATGRQAADPGEAAFDASIAIKDGHELIELADLGTVTTGATLIRPAFGETLDGNAPANRAEFDFIVENLLVPENAQLVFRWRTATGDNVSTNGWLYGLDDVRLELNPTLIPEPGTWLLATIGFICLLAFGKRSSITRALRFPV